MFYNFTKENNISGSTLKKETYLVPFFCAMSPRMVKIFVEFQKDRSNLEFYIDIQQKKACA